MTRRLAAAGWAVRDRGLQPRRVGDRSGLEPAVLRTEGCRRSGLEARGAMDRGDGWWVWPALPGGAVETSAPRTTRRGAGRVGSSPLLAPPHTRWDAGLSYSDYVEQITYLLFLKMATKDRPSPAQPRYDGGACCRALWQFEGLSEVAA